MTIKKNFLLLSTTIIAIPLLSILFILVHNYLRSPNRLLINGTKEFNEIQDSYFSKSDVETLKRILSNLPPNVETVLFSEENKILLSSIPDFKLGEKIESQNLMKIINDSSDKYFYQFTTPSLEKTKTLLMTRIAKIHREKRGNFFRNNLIKSLIFFLFFVVLICVFIIIHLSKTIFKSIKIIESGTQEIANGDLNYKIDNILKEKSSNEIISISKSIEKMRLALLEVQKRKNKFIMGISHDLRTPVAIIKGYTEALTDGIISEPADTTQALDLIKSKTNQLETMIDTLINFTKLDNANIIDNISEIQLAEIINAFVKDAEITGTVFKRNVITDIKIDDSIKIKMNSQLVSRAFENLYSNALRYTKEDDTIEIKAFNDKQNAYFVISDTGCGINKDELSSIFDLFYRSSASRREEGMGIGLSVVKNIIDIHGWKINVESEKDKGTSFTITIPILP